MPKVAMIGGAGRGTGCGCAVRSTGRVLATQHKALRAGSYKGSVGVVLEGQPRGVRGLGRVSRKGKFCIATKQGKTRCFKTKRAALRALSKRR